MATLIPGGAEATEQMNKDVKKERMLTSFAKSVCAEHMLCV